MVALNVPGAVITAGLEVGDGLGEGEGLGDGLGLGEGLGAGIAKVEKVRLTAAEQIPAELQAFT